MASDGLFESVFKIFESSTSDDLCMLALLIIGNVAASDEREIELFANERFMQAAEVKFATRGREETKIEISLVLETLSCSSKSDCDRLVEAGVISLLAGTIDSQEFLLPGVPISEVQRNLVCTLSNVTFFVALPDVSLIVTNYPKLIDSLFAVAFLSKSPDICSWAKESLLRVVDAFELGSRFADQERDQEAQELVERLRALDKEHKTGLFVDGLVGFANRLRNLELRDSDIDSFDFTSSDGEELTSGF